MLTACMQFALPFAPDQRHSLVTLFHSSHSTHQTPAPAQPDKPVHETESHDWHPRMSAEASDRETREQNMKCMRPSRVQPEIKGQIRSLDPLGDHTHISICPFYRRQQESLLSASSHAFKSMLRSKQLACFFFVSSFCRRVVSASLRMGHKEGS